MPAYSIKIPKHRCKTYGRRATEEVFNQTNASMGWFCAQHAKAEIKRGDAWQKDYNAGRG